MASYSRLLYTGIQERETVMERQHLIQVLIVDDNALVREGLAAIVGRQSDMAVAAEAGNGAEAIALFRRHQPDVTLMDMRMPDMDGVAATQAICAEFPQARILVVTTFLEEEAITRALRAGATGYVLKDMPTEQLINAIRATIASADVIACASP